MYRAGIALLRSVHRLRGERELREARERRFAQRSGDPSLFADMAGY